MRSVRNLFLERPNNRGRENSGQASGLSVTISMIQESVEDSVKVSVNNLSHVRLAIMKFKPVNVIITNVFLSVPELMSLKKMYPSINFFLSTHSNIPFSSIINAKIDKLFVAANHGIKIICNDDRFARAMNTDYLPNIYVKEIQDPLSLEIKDELNVICGGAIRPFKNQLIQAFAAIRYADELNVRLNFHCNFTVNNGGQCVVTNLKALFRHNPRHKLVSLPWRSNNEFVKAMKSFHIGMQVSLSESFNATAGDYTAAGLPMVVSDEVRWASDGCKASCHDVDDIVDKMRTAGSFVIENQSRLVNHTDNATKLWNTFLNERT